MKTKHLIGEIKAAESSDYDGTFVLTTGNVDRDGDIIEPDGLDVTAFLKNPITLWQHDHKNPVGTWENIRHETGRWVADLKLATTNLANMTRKLIQEGVLKAVSVGFLPKENGYERIEDEDGNFKGYRFLKTELLEVSLVSVPANAEALLISKSFNANEHEEHAVFGTEEATKSASPELMTRVEKLLGESATPEKQINSKLEDSTMTLSERIKGVREEIVALKEQLSTAAQEYADEPDTEKQETVDGLAVKVEEANKQLSTLENAEKSIMASVQEAKGAVTGAPGVITTTQDYGPGDLIVRRAVVSYLSHMKHQSESDVIRERYRNDKGLEAITKAAVAPGDTTTAAWAADLLAEQVQGFIEQVSNNSVYGAMRGAGMALNFAGAGSIKIPSETSSSTPSGAFVGEGAPIPVKDLAFTSQSLSRQKMAVIVPMTEELVEATNGQIEAIVRRAILRETSKVLDTTLLDNAAATAVRPAGLQNGVTPTASAGATAADIITDLKALIGAFANDETDQDITIVMNPLRRLGLMTVTNAVGEFAFRNEVASGSLMGYALAVSSNVTAAEVIAVNGTDFATAYDGPQFSMSNTATLHMEDTAPLPIVDGVTAADPTRSLFQTDTVAIKMRLPVTWAMTRAGQVTALSGVAW